MYKAIKEFYSISLGKSFVKGQEIKEDIKMVDKWVQSGNVEKIEKPKRQTKELKNAKKTK